MLFTELSIKFIDMVNSPPHYKQGKFETIEIIESLLSPEEFIGYLKGSFIKYISRAEHKGYLAEDLNKAEWFFNKYKQKQIWKQFILSLVQYQYPFYS